MREMIYDFTTHSLYYTNKEISVSIFSLAIDTLEMVFELQTGKLIGIQGFLPLVQASNSKIFLPKFQKGEYLLQKFDLSKCNPNEVYDWTKIVPQTQKYFEKLSIKYDAENGIIQIGETLSEQETAIKVNDNILCGLDQNLYLKCVYIMPTQFIGKEQR